MPNVVDARTLKAWLSDGGEIALLDVREHGQFGEQHLFFAIPLAYSRFEIGLPALVPNTATRIVLCDGGDGIAERAARRAEAMGYASVHVLAGGVAGWERAGFTLYAGVNVPSKTFGELVEHQRDTPRITAQALQAMRDAGENFVIVDGRPWTEYTKMNIPDGICCPNGELALRIGEIAPDPKTRIIVNCAGRTRSIIGAQTLIDFGVPNPVAALENGTQGWFLSGLQVERGASRRYPDARKPADLAARTKRARVVAGKHGVAFVAPDLVQAWLADASRTTYLLDVRTPEEVGERSVAGFMHAPGGQLIQATDQWIGVKGARLVLIDAEGVRAAVVAAWLRQLGHEACVLEGGVAAAAQHVWQRTGHAPAPMQAPAAISAGDAHRAIEAGAHVVDLRSSAAYRAGHISQAVWSIRPRVATAVADAGKMVILVADEPESAALAAIDLAEAGCRNVQQLSEGQEDWQAAGLSVVASPGTPADADCLDFLFFTHERQSNADAARQYLSWEIGLVGQLDAQERAVFRI